MPDKHPPTRPRPHPLLAALASPAVIMTLAAVAGFASFRYTVDTVRGDERYRRQCRDRSGEVAFIRGERLCLDMRSAEFIHVPSP